jgi:hypothetical protein
MKTRHHLLLATICILLWACYYLLGIQYDYFQDFSRESMLILLLTTFMGIIPIITIIVLSFIKVPFLRMSVWLAFYASVPLFILDYIFVGIIKGEGLHFLVSHWHLTLGYFLVWFELPLIGKSLEKLSLKIINFNI